MIMKNVASLNNLALSSFSWTFYALAYCPVFSCLEKKPEQKGFKKVQNELLSKLTELSLMR